jgi:hypothetical protein
MVGHRKTHAKPQRGRRIFWGELLLGAFRGMEKIVLVEIVIKRRDATEENVV